MNFSISSLASNGQTVFLVGIGISRYIADLVKDLNVVSDMHHANMEWHIKDKSKQLSVVSYPTLLEASLALINGAAYGRLPESTQRIDVNILVTSEGIKCHHVGNPISVTELIYDASGSSINNLGKEHSLDEEAKDRFLCEFGEVSRAPYFDEQIMESIKDVILHR